MATRMADQFPAGAGLLRYEPTPKRVRALLGGRPALDSTRAVLVWEPRRVVPQYAVPVEDVGAELTGSASPGPAPPPPDGVPIGPGGALVLTPDFGFDVHTTEGEPLTVRLGGEERPGAAFRPADPDLHAYVVLDFPALDAWLEEDEEVVGHPRDPFHRIDVRRSSRHVRVTLDGQVLAESSRPSLLFETNLPVRYYLPAGDVRLDLLRATDTTSTCAYKGVASYWAATLPDRTVPDIAWGYRDPLPDAVQVKDLLCFFQERIDIGVDGVPLGRPRTPWS